MELFAFFILFLISAWVFSDATSRGKSGGSAFLWALGVFILLIVFLPLWLILRPKKSPDVVILEKPKLCTECGKYYEGTPSYCPNCGKQIQVNENT